MSPYAFLPLAATIFLTALFWRMGISLRLAWVAAGLITIAGCLADWYLLTRLPQLKLSFGRVSPPLFMLNFIRLAPLVLALGLIWFSGQTWQRVLILAGLGIFQVGFLAATFNGMVVEPFRLTVTDVPIVNAPAFFPDRPLRILQLSDLHVEHLTKREAAVLDKVKSLAPDLIVLTGDYLNKSYVHNPRSQQETRAWLAQLQAPYGVFAVNGNVDEPESLEALFNGLENIRLLDDEIVPIKFPGDTLYLVGVTAIDRKYDPEGDYGRMEALLKKLPPQAYSLLIYHYPKRVDAAAKYGVNLMLSGDTHGGQVRLPLIGSVIVQFDNPYMMGRYQVQGTTLFVSRGIGLQGGLWPRIRLNCPPEIVSIEISH